MGIYIYSPKEKLMKERIIGIIENVQAKPPGALMKKTCDLVFADTGIACIFLGTSTTVSAMLGNAAGGTGGAIAFYASTQPAIDEKRKKGAGKSIGKLLAQDKENFFIKYSDIEKEKSIYKTGFFDTLFIAAQLVVHAKGKKYVFDTPCSTKNISKQIILRATGNIRVG